MMVIEEDNLKTMETIPNQFIAPQTSPIQKLENL